MNNKKALTLVELVITIIIVAIAFIPVSIIYKQVLSKLYQSRVIAVANALAEGKIDEVLGDGYISINAVGPANFASPYSGYTYEVVINYVNAADLNTPVAGHTDYKKVNVMVNHSEIGTVTIGSLLTNY